MTQEVKEMKVDLRKTIDKINPRHKESYALEQMIEDIRNADWKILETMHLWDAPGTFRKEYNVPTGFLVDIRGHRRITALLEIANNPQEYGFKGDIEDLLLQKCKVYKGITEEDAREMARDQAIGLKRGECAAEMVRLFKLGHDVREVSLRCREQLCQSGILSAGGKIWATYTAERDGTKRDNEFVRRVQNVVKHVYYAFLMGLENHVIAWFKYEKDGLKAPEDHSKVFSAKWENIRDLYSACLVEDEKKGRREFQPDWKGPIKDIAINEKGFVTAIEGGCKSGNEVLSQMVRDFVDPPTTSKGLSKQQKEDFAKTTHSEGVRGFATMIATNVLSTEWREHDAAYAVFDCLRKAIPKLNGKDVKGLGKDVADLIVSDLPARTILGKLLDKDLSNEEWERLRS
jgi:hypothetical protein